MFDFNVVSSATHGFTLSYLDFSDGFYTVIVDPEESIIQTEVKICSKSYQGTRVCDLVRAEIANV